MRILYTGPLGEGSLTELRRKALAAMGHDVLALDQNPYFAQAPRLYRKLQVHALIGPGIVRYNRDLVARCREFRPDLLYVDQGSYLWPATVATLKRFCKQLVHYTSEYFGTYTYWYRHFLKAVHLYDVHVLTFPPAKKWLEQMGVRRIVMTDFGYDPDLHKPPILSAEDQRIFGSDVAFVGHWEPATERLIARLREAKVNVRIFGPGWHRARSLSDRSTIRPTYGAGYVKAIGAAKIGLGILAKKHNNVYTQSRTFEIPAIGTFLLTERTELHQTYFTEPNEVAFYSSDQELIEKARYYLEHDAERETIASAGFERCTRSGYTHEARVREVFRQIM